MEEAIPPKQEEKLLRLRSRQGRQMIFEAVLDNQPPEFIKEFYLGNRYILARCDDPYYYLRDAVGKGILGRTLEKKVTSDTEAEAKIKAAALRRFELDLEAAENFSRLGILPEVKALEAEEISQLERGKYVPAINPKYAELIRQAKFSSNP